MRYLLFVLLSVLSLEAKPFKVASYNVENLFDANFQGSEYEEYIPHRHNWNARMVQIKLEHTAEVICDLDADILGLQEIENAQILQRLSDLLRRVGCPYRYSAITHKQGAPIQVALLSRYPIRKSRDIVVSRAPRVRDILEAEIEVQGHALTLFVNHWKSKGYDGFESKRIAYARALKRRLATLPLHKEYILLGDFNSDYNAEDTLSDKNNDTGGKTAFNDILPTRINGQLVSETDLLKAKQPLLYTLWLELPIQKRWSQKFYNKRSTPDQIVIPPSLVDGRGIEYVNDSFGVFHRDYLFTKRGYINRWRYKHGRHMAKGYSDHLPVFAWFDTLPYKAAAVHSRKSTKHISSIDDLYTLQSLDHPVLLKDASVIFKRGNHAVIKQHSKGRGIFLYGCAARLKEGMRYDLQVEGLQRYKGLVELLGVHIVDTKGEVNLAAFRWKSLRHKLRQNEIVEGIEGIYRHRYLYVGEGKIPIYFKKKNLLPKEGSRLKIAYAHIGYYKRVQLVVYSRKDFSVLE